jgi:hypothetical protein
MLADAWTREERVLWIGIPSRTWKPMLSQSGAVSQLWRGIEAGGGGVYQWC